MNYLITGGCGFIGREVIRKLQANQADVIRVLDNESVCNRDDLSQLGEVVEVNGDYLNWEHPIQLVVGDVRNKMLVSNASVGADVVIHLAANTGVAPSVEDPYMDCDANVFGTLNVLESCRHNGISRMVFASSGAPLGVQEPPLHEELAPHPASPYGASKLAGEGYCSAYFHSFGVESVVLRFGNVYGPGSGHKSSVVAKFIRKALNGEKLEIYGDGSQTRDFIYIDDLTNAVLLASSTKGIAGETFQIATNKETTVAELTDALIETFVELEIEKPKVIYSEPRIGDVARNFSNTSKAKNILNWNNEVELSKGLRKTVSYFKTS